MGALPAGDRSRGEVDVRQGTQNATAVLGFALFLTINATSVWGGVFPFFPADMQTPAVTSLFYYAQAVALSGTFLAGLILSFRHHELARTVPVAAAAVPLFLGSSGLVAAMYLPTFTFPLVIGAGVLLGVGSAAFFTIWQTCFSAQSLDRGGLLLVLGTGLAAVFYFLLYLVPIAVTAFLIPLILVPLCALCLSMERRSLSLDQPMFEDDPRRHPQVYRQVGRVFWKQAVCIGMLGFASGIIRAIALGNAVVGDIVNMTSMAGAFIGAIALLAVWERHSFRISLYATFRVLFPFLVTAFLLLPFLGAGYLDTFAGITYMVFSVAGMLMMVHCTQITRDDGVNPVFIYSFFAAIVYSLQAVGFVFGQFSENFSLIGLQPLSIVALGSVWVLSVALVVCDQYPLRIRPEDRDARPDIEFIALKRRPRVEEAPAPREMADEGRPDWIASPEDPEAPIIKDRISKKCLALKERYGLTSREAEIAEYIARGFSVASTAEKLVISENTIRAHSKHIYTKLDIHKRQELLDLLDTV